MNALVSAKTPDLERAGAERVSRGMVRLAITGTLVLAAGSFWLSYFALRELAILSGIPEANAWVWPLIVDGVILEATVSVVALAEARPEARRFAWLLLSSGALVSVAANITHALIVADARVPALVAAAVASVPPLVLLASTHLTVELSRSSHPATPAPAIVRQDPGRTSQTPAVARSLPASALGTSVRPGGDVAPPAPGSKRRRSPAERARARQLAESDPTLSHREIGVAMGVHPTTISRWLAAPDGHTGRSLS